jgi:DNA-binding beta-propeller fold protein YncE
MSWSTGYAFNFGQAVVANGFWYVPNYDTGTITKTSLDGTVIAASWCSGLSIPQACVQYGDYLYVTTGTTISKVSLANPTVVTTFASGLTFGYGLTIYGTDLYVADAGGGKISKLSLIGGDNTLVWATASTPAGLAVYGTDLYVACISNDILKIPFSSGTPAVWSSIESAFGIAVYGEYLYVSSINGLNVTKISILDEAIKTTFVSFGAAANAVMVYNSYLYAGYAGTTIGKYLLTWATTGANPQGSAIDEVNGFLYVANSNGGSISKIVLATGASTPLATIGLGNPVGLVIDSTHTNLYYTDNGSGDLNQIDLGTLAVTLVVSGLAVPLGLTIDATDTYLYAVSGSTIRKISIATPRTNVEFATGFSDPYGMAIDSTGTYMYVANRTTDTVRQVVMSSGALTAFAPSGLNAPNGVAIDSTNTNLYVSNNVGNTISQVVISSQAVSVLESGFSAPTGLSLNSTDTYLYVNNFDNNTVNRIVLSAPAPPPPPPPPPIVCFKEGSKILTDKGYVVIEDLRKGDLVKTLKHGFMPIDMIGKRDIVHHAFEERIKDQLYKCSQSEYPELFEPLVITGCHAILVDEFVSPEQREQTSEVLGRIFVTDKKYRLPACVDNRTTVYEIKGECTIYHLALENDEYFANYGIYANGLLVETCSKRYLKELSNMELIE